MMMDESKRERAHNRLGFKTLNIFLGSFRKNRKKKAVRRGRRGKDNVDEENDADDENDDSR